MQYRAINFLFCQHRQYCTFFSQNIAGLFAQQDNQKVLHKGFVHILHNVLHKVLHIIIAVLIAQSIVLFCTKYSS